MLRTARNGDCRDDDQLDILCDNVLYE